MSKRAGRQNFLLFYKPVISGYFSAGTSPTVLAAEQYALFMGAGGIGAVVLCMTAGIMTAADDFIDTVFYSRAYLTVF